MFRRRSVKTHTRLAREELNEGLGHLRLAAAHAADGASGALAPRVESARKAVQPGLAKARTATMDSVDSLFSAALEGSRKASKRATKDAKKMARKGKKQVQKQTGLGKKQRRWPKVLGGLAVAGAVAGAAAAYMKRRQANNAWDEYDATRTTSDAHAVLDKAKSTMDAGVDKASTAAKEAKDRASDLIGSKSTPNSPTENVGTVGVDKSGHNGRA